MVASSYTPPLLRPLQWLKKAAQWPKSGLMSMGHFITFLVRSFAAAPTTMRQYRKEVWRLLADITWGNGALLVGGGTFGVMLLLGVMSGATVGIEGYAALHLLRMDPVVGGLSAFATTREIAPLLAATAFTAQAGCRFTAQLGSMRINEEIDALDSIAIRPLPYLVTTRMIAGAIAIIPLYTVALAGAFIASQLMYEVQSTDGTGSYSHYFATFVISIDMVYSVIKAVVFALLTTFIQCYYGYFASGGPEGVGVAAGHAIRLSIISIVFANLVMTIIFWGSSAGFRISG